MPWCSATSRGSRRGRPSVATGDILSVPVGDGLLGRVVNPLGEPIDGKGALTNVQPRRMEIQAPGITRPQARPRADADRHQGDRLDDPDRSWPARADHRRPQDRQDHHRHRHDPQPEGSGREVHLRGDRAEGVHRRPDRSPRSKNGAMDYTTVVVARRPTRLPSSTSRPMPDAPWVSTGWRTASTP